MSQIHLYGVKIDNVGLDEAVEHALTDRGEPCWVVTPNALMLDACRKDASYADLLDRATLSLADGAGVLLAARRMGTPLVGRVAGIEFGEALLGRAAREGLRVFFLGGGDGVAQKAAQALALRYEGLRVCGAYWGYFQKEGEDDRRVTELIRAARPDILFVCFGFPMQERWIAEHIGFMDGIRVVAGLGGSLDVWSGQLRRAPRVVSSIGMEWLWRMAREPKRLKNLPTLARFALYGGRTRAHTEKNRPQNPCQGSSRRF